MTPLMLPLVLSLRLLDVYQIPAGAQLHVRLTSAVGSYASQPGMPIQAVLIAPVLQHGETLLAAGAVLSGTVAHVSRVGFGIRHETASLDLDFDRIALPPSAPMPLFARVLSVDNGREKVSRTGRILGVRATGSICYRVSGYVRAVIDWEPHAALADWLLKSLITELPEPEIYYSAGTELTLALTRNVTVPVTAAPSTPPPLELADFLETADPEVRQGNGMSLTELSVTLPTRTVAPSSKRASDLTNVLIVGTREQVAAAFTAAGWTKASPVCLRRRILFIRAVAESHSYASAPMSPLLLDGAPPDINWQKSLNDVAKRDHIRIWSRPETWHGRQVWLGAATHDVDLAYLRRGQTFSHRIDSEIDNERDKVGYDLAFTSCVERMDWIDRPGIPRLIHNATGDTMKTDARLLILVLNDCQAPRLTVNSLQATALPMRGGRWQRFLRREILTTRSDLLRTNPYWRTYEGGRMFISYVVRRVRKRGAALAAVAQAAPVRTP